MLTSGITYLEALQVNRRELQRRMESIVAEQIRALGFDPDPETILKQCPPGWELVMRSEDPHFMWRDEIPGVYRDRFAWHVSVEILPTHVLLDERNRTNRLDAGFWPTRDRPDGSEC